MRKQSMEEFEKKVRTLRLNDRCEYCYARKQGKCDGISLPLAYSFAELGEEYDKHKNCDDLRIYIDEDGDMNVDIAYHYVINHETPRDLYTKEGASWWVYHLLKKSWFDWHDANAFLRKVYEHAGIPGSDTRIELI